MTAPPRLSGRRRRRAEDDDRILPLVNIVFLLLIFFMIAGRLSASDPFETAPPRSATAADAPAEAPLVLLAADGRLALDGAPVEEAALLAAIRAGIARGGPAEIRVKADGRAEAPELVRLLRAFEAAGVETARLLALPAAPEAGG